MSKKLWMALVGVVGAAIVVVLPSPASATEEQEGHWAMPFQEDPCYDPCASHLPICKCYVLPPIIVH